MDHDPLPRRTILATCCLGMLNGAGLLAVPAILLTVIAADLDMQLWQRGRFLSAGFFGSAIMIIVSGVVADRWGVRALMVASSVIMFAGFWAISFAENQLTAVAGMVMVGTGRGMVGALYTPVVCAIYPQRRLSMTNILHAFFGIGLIVHVSLILVLREFDWPWRSIIRAVSFLVLPQGVLMLFIPLPRQMHVGDESWPIRQMLRQPIVLMIALALFLCGLSEASVLSWLPNIVEESAKGQSVSPRIAQRSATIGLLLFGVAMLIGRFSSAAIVHGIGVFVLLSLTVTIASLALLAASLPLGAIWSVVWLVIVGVSMSSFFPTILGAASDRFPHGGPSMYAMLVTASMFGNVAGPSMVGFVAEGVGLRPAMAIIAAAPVLMLLVIWMTLTTRR